MIEDTDQVRELIVASLAGPGFTLETASDAAEARRCLRARRPDVVVLDIELPDVTGFDLLRELVGDVKVPVVVVSGRGAELDRVLGLEIGAEDYVVKPFLPRELATRVRRAASRGAAAPPPRSLRFGPLTIDLDGREVVVDGERVDLTAKEFDLLAHLALHPGRTLRRAELLAEVWKSSPEWQSEKTVTEHVRRIRTKVERDPTNPRWIRTVSRVGYRFDP